MTDFKDKSIRELISDVDARIASPRMHVFDDLELEAMRVALRTLRADCRFDRKAWGRLVTEVDAEKARRKR